MFGSRHSCLEFRFRVGVRTLVLHVLSLCGSVRSRVSLGRTLFCQCVFCCVARRLCFSLAACFHVLMSCFKHGWWFVCWPCACVFVLCEHVASVLVFCVPCALMSIWLLLPVYWLIFPSCSPSLPSSFAPFIISLCLSSSSSYVDVVVVVDISYIIDNLFIKYQLMDKLILESLSRFSQSIQNQSIQFACWIAPGWPWNAIIQRLNLLTVVKICNFEISYTNQKSSVTLV